MPDRRHARHPNYIPPAGAGSGGPGKTEKDGIDPIPFSRLTTLPFPTDALAAYDVLPEKPMHTQANYILDMIRKRKLDTFDRRMAMRACQNFKTVDELQPVLDFLEDYGYIFEIPQPAKPMTGRPPLPRYTVNPKVIT